jgi:hypothetical protein
MLYPAALWKVLRKGLLVGADGGEIFVEGDSATAGRPSIYGDENGRLLIVHNSKLPNQYYPV